MAVAVARLVRFLDSLMVTAMSETGLGCDQEVYPSPFVVS